MHSKKKTYSANAESAIGFCGDPVSTQMLPLGVMVMMMMNIHPKNDFQITRA